MSDMQSRRRHPTPSLLLLIGVTLLWSGCRARHSAITDEVKVDVTNVDVDNETGLPFVLLEDKPGGRNLQVFIGEPEARSIILQLKGTKAPRPLTNDLLRTLLERTGNHVDRVVVDDLREGTYFADIYLDHGRYQVDSRPSDAIALALAARAPIYVVARLLEPQGPASAQALGLRVQELSADIADYFGAQPATGVLIADVSGEASQAGIQRGDLLTRIGDTQIKDLDDFRRQTAGLTDKSVLVTVRRRDGEHRVSIRAAQN